MRNPVTIGIFGEFQSGKSLLVNCLLRRAVASVGRGTATTRTAVRYRYAVQERAEWQDAGGRHTLAIPHLSGLDTERLGGPVDVYLRHDLLRCFTLIDIPGLGNDDADTSVALAALRETDYAIVVSTNARGVGETLRADIDALRQQRVPYYFIINCTASSRGRWDPSDESNADMAAAVRDALAYKPLPWPFGEETVPVVNLMWHWYAVSPQGSEPWADACRGLARAYDLDLPEVTAADIEEASGFAEVEKIFSMDNEMYLTLRREMRAELDRLRREMCPAGTVMAFAAGRVPEGWLPCDGSAVAIERYPDLYHAIGTTYGPGGKPRMFRLPDLRGRFVRGWNNGSGRKLGTYQDDCLQRHAHAFDEKMLTVEEGGNHVHMLDMSWQSTVSYVSSLTSSVSKSDRLGKYEQCRVCTCYNGEHSHKLSLSGTPVKDAEGKGLRTGDETRPKNVALLYCIKC